jgi:hypothetical protein
MFETHRAGLTVPKPKQFCVHDIAGQPRSAIAIYADTVDPMEPKISHALPNDQWSSRLLHPAYANVLYRRHQEEMGKLAGDVPGYSNCPTHRRRSVKIHFRALLSHGVLDFLVIDEQKVFRTVSEVGEGRFEDNPCHLLKDTNIDLTKLSFIHLR